MGVNFIKVSNSKIHYLIIIKSADIYSVAYLKKIIFLLIILIKTQYFFI